MNQAILEAKAQLEAAGLEVKPSGERSLWIAASTKDAGDGVRLSNDASALLQQDGNWVAVFPAVGTLNYEVAGDLPELLPIIRRVYTHYRRLGGLFNDAFKRSVSNSDSYLVGRFPPEERPLSLPPSRRLDIGTEEGLKFQIEWSEPSAARTGPEYSRGKARLWIGGEIVWGRDATWYRSEIDPAAFLEFLSRSWTHLRWEEGYPLGLQPREPSLLRVEAKTRWETLAEDLSSEEEKVVTAFEGRHDLAKGIPGSDLPFVRVIREGNQMWLASQHRTVLRPASEVLEQLSAVGDAIKTRIADSDKPRDHEAIECWQRRDVRHPIEIAEIATGLSALTLQWLTAAVPDERLDLDAPHGSFRLTEVLAAARQMVGVLEPETVGAAISAVARLPKVPTSELDRLSEEAEGLLFRQRSTKPYAEGYNLAGWVRNVLGIGSLRPVDPEGLLRRFGVLVKEVEIPDDLFDALACWGDRHGPAVILNKAGRHAQTSPGRRFTLAHELCHLLIDRTGALPLAEVFNGRAPWRVEARANAFAAELLLPRKRAEEVSRASSDIRKAVEDLRMEYGVSREVAVRQIQNARPSLSRQQEEMLGMMVSSLG